jgi:YihY family inner membrane protein
VAPALGKVDDLVRWFDDVQQRRAVTAVPVAVIRKFADDRGGAVGALLTYYGFVAFLPLLVVLLTAGTYLLAGYPGLRQGLLDTIVEQIPVIGPMLEEDAEPVDITGPGAFLTLAALLYGATGLYNSGQFAMAQIWNVEGVDRPGFVHRLLRALVLFTVIFLATLAGAAGSWFGVFATVPALARVASVVGGVVLNIALITAMLRIWTPSVVPTRQLLAGAALAGIAWEVVLVLGNWFVTSRLDQAAGLYGVFAYVLVALSWVYLATRIVLVATELNVVVARRLWPRRITQPPLNDQDREVLTAIVRNERRRPEQHIHVTYDESADREAGDEVPSDAAAEHDAEEEREERAEAAHRPPGRQRRS